MFYFSRQEPRVDGALGYPSEVTTLGRLWRDTAGYRRTGEASLALCKWQADRLEVINTVELSPRGAI